MESRLFRSHFFPPHFFSLTWTAQLINLHFMYRMRKGEGKRDQSQMSKVERPEEREREKRGFCVICWIFNNIIIFLVIHIAWFDGKLRIRHWLKAFDSTPKNCNQNWKYEIFFYFMFCFLHDRKGFSFHFRWIQTRLSVTNAFQFSWRNSNAQNREIATAKQAVSCEVLNYHEWSLCQKSMFVKQMMNRFNDKNHVDRFRLLNVMNLCASLVNRIELESNRRWWRWRRWRRQQQQQQHNAIDIVYAMRQIENLSKLQNPWNSISVFAI